MSRAITNRRTRACCTTNSEEPMQYSGRLYDERQHEILQPHAFNDAAAPLPPTPAKYGLQLTALLNKIAYHHRSPTGKRLTVWLSCRSAAASRRPSCGETPPAPLAADEKPSETPAVAAVGVRLRLPRPRPRRLRHVPPPSPSGVGKPVLLVFYRPSSPTTADVLGYAQRMSDSHPQDLTVLGPVDVRRLRYGPQATHRPLSSTLPPPRRQRPAHQLRRRWHAQADAARRPRRLRGELHGLGNARRRKRSSGICGVRGPKR